MQNSERPQLAAYLRSAAWIGFVAGGLLGLCGLVGSLARVPGVDVLKALIAFGLVGLTVACVIGLIGWAVRAPVVLSQLGAAYSVIVGILIVSAVESVYTGGDNTAPVTILGVILAWLALATVSALVGVMPNLAWLAYARVRQAANIAASDT